VHAVDVLAPPSRVVCAVEELGALRVRLRGDLFGHPLARDGGGGGGSGGDHGEGEADAFASSMSSEERKEGVNRQPGAVEEGGS
jgi:hypothetical protein